jgi:hypothetical protein
MNTFNENDVDRNIKGTSAGGQFATKTQSAAELTLAALGGATRFDDNHEIFYDDNGGQGRYPTYASALDAADGNKKRVWTIVDEGYNDSEKIWRFETEDGDAVVNILADSQKEAHSLAVDEFQNQGHYLSSAEFIYLESVFTGDVDGGEAEWSQVPSEFMHAGGKPGSWLGYMVSVEPWASKHERFAWR